MATQLTIQQLMFAIGTGLVPSLIWLFFWLRVDKEKREPKGLLFLCFLLGALSVIVATMLQKATLPMLTDTTARIVVWAGIEEVLKFLVFYIVVRKSAYNEETIDPALYMITAALGFAALENILYVIHPSLGFNVTTGLLTGGLRFFGSTLLHAIASCFVGISIVLWPRTLRVVGVLLGIGGAIFLHATFNFFILKNDTASFLQIYGYLWVAAIISHIILEKLSRIPTEPTPPCMKKQSFFQRLAGNLRFDDNEEDFQAVPPVSNRTESKEHVREGLPVHMADTAPLYKSEQPSVEEEPGELPVDVYETPHEVIIQTLIAGVQPDHLNINITRDVVSISGKREENKSIRDESYHIRELYWGAFTRTVELPAEIEIDSAEAIERHGMLMIKLPKIDKGRKAALKIKSI